MKKIICWVLSMCLLLSVFAGCGNTSNQSQSTTGATTSAVTGKEALDGKRVVFFGNSHTYYSRCVIDQGQSTTLSGRTNDQGIFYVRQMA